MILAVGVGNYTAAFFHLLTHAMFKACLFYGSGSVIHAMHHSLHDLHDHDTDPQDMRNMGGFHKKMPITSTTMTLATLAIAGVPLFSGFLSKDAILAGTLYFVDQNPQHMILAFFGFGAAAITAFYMFRLIFLTFHGEPKMPKVFEGVHESPSLMTAPLVILAALSTYIFYTLPINLIPWKDYGWFTKLIKAKDSVVAGTPSAKEIYDGVHYMHDLALVISLTVASIGIGLSFLMYYRSTISSKSWAKRFGPFYRLSLNKYYFDEIYNRVFYQPFLKLCNIVAIIDWDLYDKYFINGIENRIEQILANLLDNSISFSEDNKNIIVKVSKLENKNIVINIIDEGQGFKEKDTSKIFKRFYSNRPDKFGEHSGLGLNIVKNLVELHSGTIKASNRVDQKGANMEITFPKL